MTIYNPDGVTTFLSNLIVDDDSVRQSDLMGDDTIELRFSLAEFVAFPMLCRTTFEGRTYYLFHAPEVTKRHNRQFDYVMPMYTASYMLHTTMMRNIVINYSTTPYTVGGDLRLKFPLTAKPAEHLQMVADCLNVKDSGWTISVGSDVENVDKVVTYDMMYCDAALTAIAEAYGTETEIVGKCIKLGKVEYNKDNPLSMSYGKNNGFKSGIVRRNDTELPPMDVLYIQGGEQNIPEHYGQTATTSNNVTTYSGNKSDTLLLPKNWACLYDGEKFIFIDSPAIKTSLLTADSYYIDGTKSNGSMCNMYKNDGTQITTGSDLLTTLLGLPSADALNLNNTRCYVSSSDGRSIKRVGVKYSELMAKYYTARKTHVESVYDATEIYPMRVGYVTYVEAVSGGTNSDGQPITFYDFYDATDCPNYEQCYIAGEKMTVIFQDGMLAGREFELNTYDSGVNKGKPICKEVSETASGHKFYDDEGHEITARKFELCQSVCDGVIMPNGSFVPTSGNHYVVFHCSLPTQYISGISYGAEFRAFREMSDYFYHYGDDTYTFNGAVDTIWSKKVWNTEVEAGSGRYYKDYFATGQHVKITDTNLFGTDGLVMRVVSVRQPINKPHAVEMTLSNAIIPKFDWVSQLSQTVRDVRVRKPVSRPNNPIMPNSFNGVRENTEFEYTGGTIIKGRRAYPVFTPSNLELAVVTDLTTLETKKVLHVGNEEVEIIPYESAMKSFEKIDELFKTHNWIDGSSCDDYQCTRGSESLPIIPARFNPIQ